MTHMGAPGRGVMVMCHGVQYASFYKLNLLQACNSAVRIDTKPYKVSEAAVY